MVRFFLYLHYFYHNPANVDVMYLYNVELRKYLNVATFWTRDQT